MAWGRIGMECNSCRNGAHGTHVEMWVEIKNSRAEPGKWKLKKSQIRKLNCYNWKGLAYSQIDQENNHGKSLYNVLRYHSITKIRFIMFPPFPFSAQPHPSWASIPPHWSPLARLPNRLVSSKTGCSSLAQEVVGSGCRNGSGLARSKPTCQEESEEVEKVY